MNATVSALRFFIGMTLARNDATDGMTTVGEKRKLPVVLNPQEVARLLRHPLRDRGPVSIATR